MKSHMPQLGVQTPQLNSKDLHAVTKTQHPRAPQLEETPETPPSSRAEGLLFLHGLVYPQFQVKGPTKVAVFVL